MSVLAVYDCMLFFAQATRPERTRETFQLVERELVTLCFSDAVLEEIRDVLTREEYRAKFPSLTAEAVAKFLQLVAADAKLLKDVPPIYTLERDPKDSKYINLAIAAGAPFLVTRDKDLLALMEDSSVGKDFRERFSSLQIVSPQNFVEWIDKNRS